MTKYEAWSRTIAQLPAPAAANNRKMLLIRLDDIGDYVLFRNCLSIYSDFFVPQGYRLYLLGNQVWKPIFDRYDAKSMQALWLDKKRYGQDSAYRLHIWEQLRLEGFETVICPSRTRPLLLDDLCTLACAPRQSYAAANTLPEPVWNTISDRVYTVKNNLSLLHDHEFTFNVKFALHICPSSSAIARPYLEAGSHPPCRKPYILCFVGASAKSKQWPAARWISLIRGLSTRFAGQIFIAGGPADKHHAGEIAAATKSTDIAGTKTLPEMIDLISHSIVTVTNDTMAAHIGAASGARTIIVTTGNNGYRFTDYSSLSMDNVKTVYSPRYKKLLQQGNTGRLYRFQGVTSDIAAVDEQEVLTLIASSVDQSSICKDKSKQH